MARVAAYDWMMTTTPSEPAPEPTVVPSGDPGASPVDPDQVPAAPIPEAEPTGR